MTTSIFSSLAALGMTDGAFLEKPADEYFRILKKLLTAGAAMVAPVV